MKTKHIIMAGLAVIVAGFAAAVLKERSAERQLQEEIAALDAAAAERLRPSQEFIAAKASEEGVLSLGDGVYYRVLAAGSGEASPAENDEVEVEYDMMLPDGTVADSRHTPVAMRPGNLIAGAKAALLRMTPGDDWEIYIPQEQGYGSTGSGRIPSYSALVFRVKLVAIK